MNPGHATAVRALRRLLHLIVDCDDEVSAALHSTKGLTVQHLYAVRRCLFKGVDEAHAELKLLKRRSR